MYHPTTRVLAVLELLQAHGRISGAEMAQRLGIDRRTLRRYIAILEELGIPITAERGRYGAYRLVPGFKLPPLMFNADEALAISVGLLAARGLGLAGAAPAVASAQAKLERVMPAELRRKGRSINETVSLDLNRGTAPDDNVALLALSGAAQIGQRVRLRYLSAQRDESEREFDPYGLAYRGGRWYAVGRCHLRQGLRSFRLDRVRSVQPLTRTFERPRDFDALDHLTFSVATMPRAHAIEVLLETDLATAKREIMAAIGILEPVPDGVLMRSQADDLDWFARELARLPFAFRVRAPAALRTAVASLAQRLRSQAERND